MNRILTTFLILISINSLAQEWANLKIDSNLTVRIPDNYEVMDTLDQHIITAQIENALIMIQRIPNKGEHVAFIKDKNDLIENYKGFQKGLIESQFGKLRNQEIIEKDGLQLIRFSYDATIGEEKQLRHCLGFLLNNDWYAVQFWELESMTTELTVVREQFFSSLKFKPGQSIRNQMSVSIGGLFNLGLVIGKILGYAVMLVVIVLLAIWISKRQKRNLNNTAD